MNIYELAYYDSQL